MSDNPAMIQALASRIALQAPVKMKSATGDFKDKCVVALTEIERDAIVTALRALAVSSHHNQTEAQ